MSKYLLINANLGNGNQPNAYCLELNLCKVFGGFSLLTILFLYLIRCARLVSTSFAVEVILILAHFIFNESNSIIFFRNGHSLEKVWHS